MKTIPEIVEMCLYDPEYKFIMYNCWYNDSELHDIYLFPLQYVAADMIYEGEY